MTHSVLTTKGDEIDAASHQVVRGRPLTASYSRESRWVSNSLGTHFAQWLDVGLTRGIPAQVRAFSFNLYEGVERTWDVELTGATVFDPDNAVWACNPIFSYPEMFFMSFEVVGEQWEQGLAAAIELVATYLRGGRYRNILREALGVAVGFADGDLTILWPETAA